MGVCLSSTITIFALAAFSLLLAANVGTVKQNSFKSNIYMLELSLKDLELSTILPQQYSRYLAETLGFADGYVLGMYGYCRGFSNGDGDGDNLWDTLTYNKADCSGTSTNYKFNLATFIVHQINTYNTANLEVDVSSISLPKDLDTYITVSNDVSRIIYITSIIAICLQFVTIFAQWFLHTFCGIFMVSILQLMTLIAAFLSSGSATALYLIYYGGLNSIEDGIRARMSINFLALTWTGAGCTLIAFVLTLFNCCCGGRKSKQKEKDNYERVIE